MQTMFLRLSKHFAHCAQTRLIRKNTRYQCRIFREKAMECTPLLVNSPTPFQPRKKENNMPILPSSSAKTTSALRANNFRDRRYLLFSVLAWVVMGLLVWKVMLPRFELFRSYQSELKKQQSDLSTLQSRIAFLDQF